MSGGWPVSREVVFIKKLYERKRAYDEYLSGFNLDDSVRRISTLDSWFYENKKVKHHSCLAASGAL